MLNDNILLNIIILHVFKSNRGRQLQLNFFRVCTRIRVAFMNRLIHFVQEMCRCNQRQ